MPEPVLTVADVADYFFPRALAGQHRSDMAFHTVRWAHLLSHVDSLVSRLPADRRPRILDIGVSLQTQLLRYNYPGCVETLDIDENETEPTDHIMDLNDLYYEDRWPRLGPYDVIVMCEVIEHLYTPVVKVLAGLKSWMEPGGYLFLQTPNAVALHKRLTLLAGRHPYMDLSDGTRTSPPHFRESTIGELISAGRAVGLEVVDHEARNYFTGSKRGTKLYNRVCEALPPSLRAGLSITYRRPE